MDYSDFLEKLIKVTATKKYSFANSKNHDGNIIDDNFTRCHILNVEIFYSDLFKTVTIKKKDGLIMPLKKYIKTSKLNKHICIPEKFLTVIKDVLTKFNLNPKIKGRMLGIFVLLIPHAIALLATAAAIGSAYVVTNLLKNKEKSQFLETDIDLKGLKEYLKNNENQNKLAKVQMIFYPMVNYFNNKEKKDQNEENSNEIEIFNRYVEDIQERPFQMPHDSSDARENTNIRNYFNNQEELKLEENEEEKKENENPQENFDEIDNRMFEDLDEEVKIEDVNPFRDNSNNPFENPQDNDNNNRRRRIEKYYGDFKTLVAAGNKKNIKNTQSTDIKEIVKKINDFKKDEDMLIIDRRDEQKTEDEINKLTIGWFIISNSVVDLGDVEYEIKNTRNVILGYEKNKIQKIYDLRRNKKKFRAIIYSKTIDL